MQEKTSTVVDKSARLGLKFHMGKGEVLKNSAMEKSNNQETKQNKAKQTNKQTHTHTYTHKTLNPGIRSVRKGNKFHLPS